MGTRKGSLSLPQSSQATTKAAPQADTDMSDEPWSFGQLI